ncbi:MAG: type II toxin-antitoxin system Phd/YefM family antitoxin [Deltaproteobacteria bacterium]|nr:type II toxin-antitoxin system Phd/YefM family antitoxin [Deltaproteobacteria bacterium]
MQNIDVNQAKQQLHQLIEQAVGGNEVIITKSGQPVVRLVAITKRRDQRQFGSARGLIEMSDDFDEPLEDFRDYM